MNEMTVAQRFINYLNGNKGKTFTLPELVKKAGIASSTAQTYLSNVLRNRPGSVTVKAKIINNQPLRAFTVLRNDFIAEDAKQSMATLSHSKPEQLTEGEPAAWKAIVVQNAEIYRMQAAKLDKVIDLLQCMATLMNRMLLVWGDGYDASAIVEADDQGRAYVRLDE